MIPNNAPPAHLGRWRSLPHFAAFIADPMAATRRVHERYGKFVTLDYPLSRPSSPAIVGAVANSHLYRAMLTDTETWRNVNISFRGLRGFASKRLSTNMPRMRGAQAAHYRQLIAPPLKRPAVAALSPKWSSSLIVSSIPGRWERRLIFSRS